MLSLTIVKIMFQSNRAFEKEKKFYYEFEGGEFDWHSTHANIGGYSWL